MPGYGLAPADAAPGLLPWSWATERLAAARNYWVATTRPDGRPHAMQVWGVWLDDRFYFSSGAASRKARNLAAQPACVVGAEVEDDSLIVEGRAALVTDPPLRDQVLAAYHAKYAWDEPEFAEPLYVVVPAVVFGFPTDADAFTTRSTRWTFAGD
jgi:nitroimidazol reductase NimA-like FMN-containing flavoprotein (pyridoxamine 5'-phosphate oxidase superfamily)